MTGQRIGVTLGDPAGIGPEIAFRSIAEERPEVIDRMVLFADPAFVKRFSATLGYELPADLAIHPCGQDIPVIPGQPDDMTAKFQVSCLREAVAWARRGEIAGLVTGPIHKQWARRAGLAYRGHTDFLFAELGGRGPVMTFVGPRLTVALVTDHLALSEVAAAITVARVVEVIEILYEFLRLALGRSAVRIAVLGLNPHAGEGGIFGAEELETIEPALAEARARFESAVITGPLAPDASFGRALAGEFDAVVAMYHDQGLIPVKVVDFDESVHTTLGLPVIRTSPDHGTAYDLAGRGLARHRSFAAALRLAAALTQPSISP